MPHHHSKKPWIKLKSYYIWHRYVGVTAALFVLVLSITGLALNHTERLGLDSRYVQSDTLLDWYGIQAPKDSRSFAVGERFLTHMGEHLYLDEHEIQGEYSRLTGGILLPDHIVVAADNSILLLTREGTLVDRISGAGGAPSGMRALGLDSEGQLVIEGGHALYQVDRDFLQWTHWQGDARLINWAAPVELPPTVRTSLEHHYRGEVLPLERVMQDLHSGRILGAWGPYLMDTAAIAMLFLAGTGIWLWWQQRRKRKLHSKHA